MDKSAVEITEPSKFLALLVIEQAIRDLASPEMCKGEHEAEQVQRDAELFLTGSHGRKEILEAWCGLADVNVSSLQRRVFK